MFGKLLVNLHTWSRTSFCVVRFLREDCISQQPDPKQTYEGVIRRLSSTFKLGRLKRDEDDRMIAPTSVAYSRQQSWCLYTLHGVGLLFYPSRRQAKARM